MARVTRFPETPAPFLSIERLGAMIREVPSERTALKVIYHRGAAQADAIRRAYQEMTR